MSTHSATHVQTRARTLSRGRSSCRVLGPLTALVGVVWAIVQPWRVTLLHPHGAELLVAVRRSRRSGSCSPASRFHLFVARPLIEDLDD